jgi:hypothetical protein
VVATHEEIGIHWRCANHNCGIVPVRAQADQRYDADLDIVPLAGYQPFTAALGSSLESDKVKIDAPSLEQFLCHREQPETLGGRALSDSKPGRDAHRALITASLIESRLNRNLSRMSSQTVLGALL